MKRYEFETDWMDFEQENGRFMEVSDHAKLMSTSRELLLEAYILINNRIDGDYLDEQEIAVIDRISEALE